MVNVNSRNFKNSDLHLITQISTASFSPSSKPATSLISFMFRTRRSVYQTKGPKRLRNDPLGRLPSSSSPFSLASHFSLLLTPPPFPFSSSFHPLTPPPPLPFSTLPPFFLFLLSSPLPPLYGNEVPKEDRRNHNLPLSLSTCRDPYQAWFHSSRFFHSSVSSQSPV